MPYVCCWPISAVRAPIAFCPREKVADSYDRREPTRCGPCGMLQAAQR
jgi:hypothetical protein